MKIVMEYKVVKGDDRDFGDKIDIEMSSGWVPQGGVAVYYDGSTMYYQAMVREVDISS